MSERQRTRAERRQFKLKAKRHAEKIFGNDRKPYRLADNMKSCSCWMCQNPRRSQKGSEKLTIQERRFFAEGIHDYVNQDQK